MLYRLAQLLYLLTPAYLANMAPPFLRFWHGWNRPVSVRWLGTHKTVLGVAVGVLVALLAAFAQARIAWAGSLVDPARWVSAGLRLGIGAMGGDLLKSFVKRRRGIAPGARWVPADQLDFVLGALALAWPWLNLDALDVAAILALTFAGDIAVNQLSFRLGIRKTPW